MLRGHVGNGQFINVPDGHEICTKCGGSGVFLSYGRCFQCKGRGVHLTAEARERRGSKKLRWFSWAELQELKREQAIDAQEEQLVDRHDCLIAEISLVESLITARGVEPVHAGVFSTAALLRSVPRCERLLRELQSQLSNVQGQDRVELIYGKFEGLEPGEIF